MDAVYPDHREYLNACIPRVEHIHLTMHAGQDLESFIVDAASSLRSLKVITSPRRPITEEALLGFKLLYGEAAPRLEKLTLTSLPFCWHPSFRHTNMRDLRVYLSRPSSSSLENILFVLKSMPLLEILVLQRCLPSNIQLAQDGDRTVVLRHLRSIALAADSTNGAYLLTYLDFPSDASVRIGTSHTRAEDLEPIKPCMHRFMEAYPLHHLAVLDGMSTFQFRPAGQCLDNFRADCTDICDVERGPELVISFYTDKFLPICRSLPLHGVTEITLNERASLVFRHDRKTTFIEAFKHMPNVEVIHARNTMQDRGPFGRQDPTDSPDPWPLRKLRELILEYTVFEEEDAERLISYVRKRRQDGFPLQRLTFLRSLVPENERLSIMPHLQEQVETVIWGPSQPQHHAGEYCYDQCAADSIEPLLITDDL